MGIYEKAARVAGEFTRETIERGRRRVAELVRVDSPPVRSGRFPNPADYLSGVDDSALYRNPAIRRPEDIQPEAILVEMGSEIPRAPSVKRRLAARGEADRYLNLIAEVADLPQKQGLSGTPTAGGLPQVENKTQLKPLVARGLTYDQGEFERMARSNPVARNAIRATVERVAQASEYYAAPDLDWEAIAAAPGMSPEDRFKAGAAMRESTERAAEILNLEWYHNPDIDPAQIIREQAYSMVPGFVLHEFGMDPTLQGRRRTTFIEHRAQSSVLRWVWDQRERWLGVVQNASGSPGLLADVAVPGITVQGMPVIDSRKLLLVSNQRIGLNLEGLSDLRASWYASQGKTEWFVSALMHRRKWGNGFPLFKMDSESAKAKGVSDSIAQAAKDFFYSGQAYMGLPPGVTMEMLQFDSDTGFLAAMEYFDKEILRSLGALASEIGQNGGSYNLADVQQAERLRQLQGYAEQIKSSRRTWIQTACDVLIGDLAVVPELRIDGIMTRSDAEVLNIWEGVGRVRALVNPDGSPLYTPEDIRTLSDSVGVPFTTAEDSAEDQEMAGNENKSAPLLVGALQVAQQVLGSLVATELNPNPIAPVSAILLLSAAGVPEETAKKMVEAQIGFPISDFTISNPTAIPAVKKIANSAEAQEFGEEMAGDDLTDGPESAASGVTLGPWAESGELDGLALVTDAGPEAAFIHRAKALGEVNTAPTSAMRETAARALEWRAKFKRGGTEVGVARARDIAGGRNLSEETIRRMKAYFSRHAVDRDADGFNSGEDGFPSAGRIAWDLWGGNAGRDFAERKAAEFDKVRESAAGLRAAKPAVMVFGRDGQAFATFRELNGAEKAVAWSRLYSGIQASGTTLTAIADAIGERQRADFAKLAAPFIAAGQVAKIAGLSVDYAAEYEKAFAPLLANWSQFNRRELLSEIKAQAGSNWTPSVEPETFAAELDQVVAARASILANQINDDLNRRLREVATVEATGAQSLAAISGLALPLATWEKLAVNAVTQTANLTREEVARVEGPPVELATYSAIMDKVTCSNCRSVDGEVFQFGSADYLENRPPNKNCLSTLGPYGNVCRCIYVYKFGTAAPGKFEGSGVGAEAE